MVGDIRLIDALDKAVAEPPAVAGSTCLVVQDGSRVLYARDADRSLIPASTMKILTGAAALERLGGDFRFATEARVEGAITAGVVTGQLWIVGDGDPVLATADYAASFTNQPQTYTPLEDLAQSIVDGGVTSIPNGVAGDESRFDTERYVATWRPNYVTDAEIGPSSALTVNDNFDQWKPKHVATASPARHAAAVLTDLLRARGVAVGQSAEGQVPAAANAIAAVRSPPLTAIVGEMLRESDNMTAELLVKEIGVKVRDSGTWVAGTAEIAATLTASGLPLTGYAAVDGSGLDRSDRATCTLLEAAVAKAGPTSALVEGFPVAGQSGTLTKRFLTSPVAGKLTAKTGTLDFVAGLVGYAEGSGGHRLAFALLANDLPDKAASGRAVQNRVSAALVAYPDVPTAAQLAPSSP